MTAHESLSFTATLLVNGHPLTVLSDAAEGIIQVPHPDSSLGMMDIAQALGVLSGPDEAWDAAREAGHVDFHLKSEISPTLFYFRHSDQGYHLYVRSGAHYGQAVFKSKYGVANVAPVEGAVPTPWLLRLAHTGQTVTLANLPNDFAMLNLECATSAQSLATNLIGDGEGGYLITRRSVPATSLRLNIVERGVDWAQG
ncbi:hypothetical protein [Pseudomonas oryzicola]|uniref:Phage tail protein n=1 Tax=Pseudomonas oryzicola TaxID=485876 RepID=A0ABS6QFT2_9PSED|nr:hypothetical protein [Pseudomonas oryzicola]MBV4493064.1 hypothetical protein [Pseudomonas oryzicola]